MRNSSDHILTSHAGSLPRPDALIEAWTANDESALADKLHNAVVDVVRHQKELGIDVPGDGEFGKPMGQRVNYGSWWRYSWQRLSGIEPGEQTLYEMEARRSRPGEIVLTSFGDRRDRASMLGIPVGRLQSVTWVVAGVLSFVSIFFQATILGLPLDPTFGLTALVTALAALALGNFTELPVIAASAVALGILEQGVSWDEPANPALGLAVLAAVVFAAIVVLAFIPWLDRSPVKSAKYRPSYRFFFWIFIAICIGLGYLGSQEPTEGLALIARILTFGYFAFFLIIMPILSFTEKTKPIPTSIADAVLTRTKTAVAAAE